MKFSFNSTWLLMLGGAVVVVPIGLYAFGAAANWFWMVSAFGGLMMLTGAWLTPYDLEIGGGE